ncbi:hypothetical protein [Niveispirillum sp. KHB5.9]
MTPPPRTTRPFRFRLLACTAVLSVVQALTGAAWGEGQAPGTLPTGG